MWDCHAQVHDGSALERAMEDDHNVPRVPYVRAMKARPHRAVLCTLRSLIEQAGGYADMERHVPELHDSDRPQNGAALLMRCAIMDVVSWFPCTSVRCPHSERYHDSALRDGDCRRRRRDREYKTIWHGGTGSCLRI